jgi:hypothetical protein
MRLRITHVDVNTRRKDLLHDGQSPYFRKVARHYGFNSSIGCAFVTTLVMLGQAAKRQNSITRIGSGLPNPA